MVAWRDAPVTGQGKYLGEMPGGRYDRYIELRLGRIVETFRPDRQAQERGPGCGCRLVAAAVAAVTDLGAADLQSCMQRH